MDKKAIIYVSKLFSLFFLTPGLKDEKEIMSLEIMTYNVWRIKVEESYCLLICYKVPGPFRVFYMHSIIKPPSDVRGKYYLK